MKRIRTRRAIGALSALATLLALTAIALAQLGYNLSWFSVDAGGGTSSGGAYALSGTIGQSDVGALSGGSYTVVSGFWAGAGPAPSVITVPFCSGEDITLVEAVDHTVRVVIEQVLVTNASAAGCDISGQMRVQVRGAMKSHIPISGRVKADNRFYSAGIPDFDLPIAGLIFEAKQVVFDGAKLLIREPYLKVPEGWGGLRAPLNREVAISNAGLIFDPDFKLPSIKAGGFELDLEGQLRSVQGGYEIEGNGMLRIPGIGQETPGGGCSINVGVTLFADALDVTVMQVRTVYDNPVAAQAANIRLLQDAALATSRSGREPVDVIALDQAVDPASPGLESATVPAGLQLSEISAGMACDPGIPIGQTGFLLASVQGTLSLRQGATYVELAAEIASKPRLAGNPLLKATGMTRLTIAPAFGLDLSAALYVLGYQAAQANVSINEQDGFRTTVWLRGGLWKTTVSIHAWTRYGRFHFTGSGLAEVGVSRGNIWQGCTDIPCGFKWCKKWGISYPCGLKYCNTCLSVPPQDLWIGGLGVEIGEFEGGVYGFKGYVSLWEYTVGFFVDRQGHLDFGDVSQYHLVDSTQVAQAWQSWQAVQRGEVSPAQAALDERYTFLPNGDVVIDTPNMPTADQRLRQPLGVTDAITRADVISQTDTIFEVVSAVPVTLTLIAPDGTEISPDNYQTVPTYTVAYQQILTYTLQRAETEGEGSRWRFVPASFDPALQHVDVTLDGTPVFSDVRVTGGGRIDYATVDPGLHTVQILPAGAVQAALTTTLEVVMGTDYTVMTLGTTTTETLTLTDTNRIPDALGQARVRFVNVISNTAPAVDLLLGGTELFDAVGYKGVGDYRSVAAGTYDLELNHATTGDPLIPLDTVTLTEGSIYTLFATEWSSGAGYTVGWMETLDELYRPMILTRYVVDQAPIGAWQVQLSGPVTETGWILAVLGAPNPPILSDLSVDATDLAQTQVSWRLHSDYSPTQVSLHVTQGPITSSLTYTDSLGQRVTRVVPLFQGPTLANVEITDPQKLAGELMTYTVDLSRLETGAYYLWAQVEDGVSPPVNGYAGPSARQAQSAVETWGTHAVRVAAEGYDPLAQLDGAALIHVDNTSTWPGSWSTTITATLGVELWEWDEDQQAWVATKVQGLYIEWEPNPHPDVDRYVVYLGTSPLSVTHVITVGDAIYQRFDAQGMPVGKPVGTAVWTNVEPNQTYYLSLGAEDEDSGRIARTTEVSATVPAGSINLSTPVSSYRVNAGEEITVTFVIRTSDDLFYPTVGLYADLKDVPAGIEVRPADGGSISGRVTTVSAAAPGGVFEHQIDMMIGAARGMPDGHYVVPFVAHAGLLQSVQEVHVLVGQYPERLYLPVILKRGS